MIAYSSLPMLWKDTAKARTCKASSTLTIFTRLTTQLTFPDPADTARAVNLVKIITASSVLVSCNIWSESSYMKGT